MLQINGIHMLAGKVTSFFKGLSTRAKILIACGIPFLLMVSISLFTYQSIQRNAHTAHWVEHTHKVIADSNELIKLLIDMETGLRGYLITGNEVFLQPFHEAHAVWGDKHQALLELVNDNPIQVNRLVEIQHKQQQWLTEVAFFKIKERRNPHVSDQELMPHITYLVNQQTGKSMIDGIRKVTNEFIAMEEILMIERQAESKQAAKLTVFIMIIGSILTFIITSLLHISIDD